MRELPLFLLVIVALGCSSGCSSEEVGGDRDQHGSALVLELTLRVPGTSTNGELGFRFGSPCDVNGDGVEDVVAGARFTARQFAGMGSVGVWSGDTGEKIVSWDGEVADGLFGQSVLAGPDVDGDGIADIIAATPNGKYDDVYRGVVSARSAVTGAVLWRRVGEPYEVFGWDMAIASDQDGDGIDDLFVGAPRGDSKGHVYLLRGRDGVVLRTFQSAVPRDQFGWYVDAVPDLSGDGLVDLVVGAFAATCNGQPEVGAVYTFSSTSPQPLRVWHGYEARGLFGEVVAGIADLDGDGCGDGVVGAPAKPTPVGGTASEDAEFAARATRAGDVYVYSGCTGEQLFHFRGRGAGELFGRMVASAGDVDGDGTDDVAIGAPWSRVGTYRRVGRVEIRSGQNGAVLATIEGDRPEMWLGWHIARVRGRERGLLVSALRKEECGKVGAGALHLYVVHHGTMMRR